MYVDKATQEEILKLQEKQAKFWETVSYEKEYEEEIELTEITIWILKNTFRKMNKDHKKEETK